MMTVGSRRWSRLPLMRISHTSAMFAAQCGSLLTSMCSRYIHKTWTPKQHVSSFPKKRQAADIAPPPGYASDDRKLIGLDEYVCWPIYKTCGSIACAPAIDGLIRKFRSHCKEYYSHIRQYSTASLEVNVNAPAATKNVYPSTEFALAASVRLILYSVCRLKRPVLTASSQNSLLS